MIFTVRSVSVRLLVEFFSANLIINSHRERESVETGLVTER